MKTAEDLAPGELESQQNVIHIAGLRKSYRTYASDDKQPASKRLPKSFAYAAKLLGRGGTTYTALDGIDLDVPKGGVFGLLGPNGAGKTTLIKILSTLILPDSGEVLVDGVDVVKNPLGALKKLQTVLAGNEGFELRITGRQNLEFFADLYGIPHDESRRRIEELIEFSHLENFADTMLQKYSTGMTRRLLVCRALLSNAPVLLFDEPTSALDPISAAEFRKLIKVELAERRKKTVLLATHNLAEAEEMCDSIALLRRGRILAAGSTMEIRSKVADVVTVSVILSRGVDGWADQLLDSLRRVDGVVSAQIFNHGVSTSALQVEGVKGLDYNRFFEEVNSTKLRIRSLEASQPSLELAFLRLNEEAAR